MITEAAERVSIAMTPNELDSFIRRTVRDELFQLVSKASRPDEADDNDESADDDLLLAEALAILRQYQNTPEAWMRWEDVLAELKTAEAAGELSN